MDNLNTLTLALVMLSACGPQMTVREFVNSSIAANKRLQMLVIAADRASAAYDMQADTSIDRLGNDTAEGQQFNKLVTESHDAFRKMKSWGGQVQESALDAHHVWLTDTRDPNATLVPIQGSSAMLRVELHQHHVTLLEIDSPRNLPIVTFDAWMHPTISPEFKSYMTGDKVDVSGVIRRRMDRDIDAPPTGSVTIPTVAPYGHPITPIAPVSADYYNPPAQPQPSSGGCSKDTDCKGARVCVQGACVAP